MEKIKHFFKINQKYCFEWGDWCAVATLLNVIAIIIFGLVASWFGLIIAIINLGHALITDRRINGIVIQLAMTVLNLYFISLI